MGFLDGILGSKEQPAHPGLPFNITQALRPVRLSARRDNCLELLVTIKNVSDAPVMASAVVEVPRALGFENLGITKVKEIRMGELAQHAERTVSFSVCATTQTPHGTYSLLLTVNQHYRDYAHILNYAKKGVEVRAV